MAGFRDKDSQLVPEADPPLGQSSSREQSVHGREVPDENRNVKSKGKNAAAKMENKCANCSFDFSSSSPSRTKVLDVVVPSQVSPGLSVSNSAPQTVKVKDAFEFVFNVKTQDGQAEVAVCSECAQYLAGVYGLVSKLSQLRTADSYFERRIKHQQDLIARKSDTGEKTVGVKKAKAGRPSVPAAKGNQYKTKKGKATKAAAARPPPAPATPKTPKAPAKRRPKGPDAAIPSNIRDFLDPRPSRNAKLTAMVLMNNSFDLSGPSTTKSTPKSSPPATAAPEVKDVKKPAPKQQRKKKAEEALAGPPAKKLKTTSEQAVATPVPKKARGKKAAATASPTEVPTPAPTVKTPKTKTPRPESAKKPGRKSAKKDKSELNVSVEPTSSTPVAEAKKGKGGKKGKGKSLDEAIAASKLSSELKIPSVPLPSVVAAKPAAKAKKEKAPKKPKIMLSKATSTKRTVQSDEDSATEVAALTPPSVNEKKEKKKKPKKSQGQSATGEHVLDLSLKIPQVPAPASAKPETPKAKKSKSKKVSETILSPVTQSAAPEAAKPSPALETKKEQKPKKPKVAKVSDLITTTQEGAPPVTVTKKPKKLKNADSLLDGPSTSASSTPLGEAASVGSKATSKTFICNSCGKDFTARWNLRRHDLLVHELPTTSPFTCVVCSQEFPARKALLEHRMSGPCAVSGPSQQTSSKPAAATPNAGASGTAPKKVKKEGAIKEPKGSKKTPVQPKVSAKQAKGTAKESKAQIEEKPPQKEKKQRKRKGDMEDGQKPPKKSKKSSSNIVNPGSKNIPTNVMSGTDVSSKGGLNATSQTPASGSALPDQNGSIDTTKTSQEAGSARSGPSVGTSSTTVNNAESVTSAPARGDTAGVGA